MKYTTQLQQLERGGSIYQIVVLLSTAILLVITGCSSPKVAQYVPPAVPSFAHIREANGLRITVDPIFDTARSKEYFNTDALAAGIFPIHIHAENTNPNASFLIQKQNFNFMANSVQKVDTFAKGAEYRSDTGNMIAAAGTVFISLPLIFAGGVMLINASAVQYNFVQAELRDQTLSPGQSITGFIYFQAQKGQVAPGGVLRVVAPDLRSQQNTQLEIPVLYEIPRQ